MLLLTLFSVLLQVPDTRIIDGYSNRLSAFPGDSLSLYLNASEENLNFTLTLNDLSGNVVASYNTRVFPQMCTNNKPWEDGFDYKIATKVVVPDIKSGVYLWANTVPLIVKSHQAKILVVYSSNTENAYSNSGGKSLYDYNSTDKSRAEKVSFLRPIALPRHSEAFLRWMHLQKFENVGYVTDQDLDDYRALKRAALLIIPGHSEYWTLAARKNFDRFVNEGKDAMVLSGNTMWWQVRYSKNKEQLICFKSAQKDNIKSSTQKTINWNDPTLGYPILRSLGADFSFAGYGVKADKGWDGFKIICDSPLLENAMVKNGDTLSCPSDEVDGAPLLSFTTEGLPVLNRQALGFERVEIIGYDWVRRGGIDGVATWLVFKPTKSSGIVINTASTDWCSNSGIGSNKDIQTITNTMIVKLLNKENVFSPQEGKEQVTTIIH